MTVTHATSTAPQGAATRRTSSVGVWIVQLVLATQFASGGLLKLAGSTEMVEMFTEVGAGQWLRYLVGVLELAGALGLLVSALAGLAALGLAGLMVGATITNIAVLDANPALPAAFLLLSGLVAWARRQHTRGLAALVTR